MNKNQKAHHPVTLVVRHTDPDARWDGDWVVSRPGEIDRLLVIGGKKGSAYVEADRAVTDHAYVGPAGDGRLRRYRFTVTENKGKLEGRSVSWPRGTMLWIDRSGGKDTDRRLSL